MLVMTVKIVNDNKIKHRYIYIYIHTRARASIHTKESIQDIRGIACKTVSYIFHNTPL